MRAQPAHGLWVIVLTVLVAVWLEILPMPRWALWGRPEWLTLVVIYWTVALPERVGIGSAWLAGLLLDVVAGAPLGQNAFVLVVIAYIGLNLYQRLRMYSAWQQAGVVFMLVGTGQLLGNWLQTLLGRPAPDLWFLLPALVSALIWPSLMLLLRALRTGYAVR